jgi:hypothetical protein
MLCEELRNKIKGDGKRKAMLDYQMQVSHQNRFGFHAMQSNDY